MTDKATPKDTPMPDNKLVIAVVPTPQNPQCGEPLSLAFTVSNQGDTAFQVTKLTFTLDKGKFPENIANGFSNVVLKSPEGWDMPPPKDGFIFTATPKDTKHGKITSKGLEFLINNIIVNNQPGITTINIAQTLAPDNSHFEQSATLTKVLPPLAIYDLHATPNQSILYGSPAKIAWSASVGAVLSLNYNGKQIQHVKGDPSQPLPHNGSYQTDENLDQNTIFTLVATSSTNVSQTNQKTLQTTVSIQPPKIIAMDHSTSVAPDGRPKATIKWNCIGTTDTTLSDSAQNILQTVNSASGSDTLDIFVDTTYTISAKNPPTIDTTTGTLTVSPPAFDWVKVVPGPKKTDIRSPILSTHAGLVLFYGHGDNGYVNYVYTSEDGIKWDNANANWPTGDFGAATAVVHSADKTYLFCYLKSGGGITLFVSTDLQTWVELSGLPFKFVDSGVEHCVDDAGSIWVHSSKPEPQLWKLAASGDRWQKMEGKHPNFDLVRMEWFAGKLWIFGSNTVNFQDVRVQSTLDGVTWTQPKNLPTPFQVLSSSFAKHGDHLCTFLVQCGYNLQPAPFFVSRMDKDGNWTQDKPTPSLSLGHLRLAPYLASFSGTLFTTGNLELGPLELGPNDGVWAYRT
jgi:hypothetical protein